MRTTYAWGRLGRPREGNDNVFLVSFLVLCHSDDESLIRDNDARTPSIHAVSSRVVDESSLILCMHIDETRGSDGVAHVHRGARSFSSLGAMLKFARKIFFLRWATPRNSAGVTIPNSGILAGESPAADLPPPRSAAFRPADKIPEAGDCRQRNFYRRHGGGGSAANLLQLLKFHKIPEF